MSGTPDTTTPAVTEEDRAKAAAPVLIARCGNDLWELSRGAAPVMTRCAGLLRFRWGMTQAACDTCGAWCGVAVANWEAVENAAERGKADALRADVWAALDTYNGQNPRQVISRVQAVLAIADGQR